MPFRIAFVTGDRDLVSFFLSTPWDRADELAAVLAVGYTVVGMPRQLSFTTVRLMQTREALQLKGT
jgi:hypothetical protein